MMKVQMRRRKNMTKYWDGEKRRNIKLKTSSKKSSNYKKFIFLRFLIRHSIAENSAKSQEIF